MFGNIGAGELILLAAIICIIFLFVINSSLKKRNETKIKRIKRKNS